MFAQPLAGAVALALLSTGVADAQEFVRADCRAVVRPTAALSFESAEHRNWYRRFWTGDCRDLPRLRCLSGSPNWNDAVSKLARRARPEQAAAVTAKACRLGETIGHEWSRAKPVRRIDTSDLKTYMAALDTAPDVPSGVARVEARVSGALKGM